MSDSEFRARVDKYRGKCAAWMFICMYVCAAAVVFGALSFSYLATSSADQSNHTNIAALIGFASIWSFSTGLTVFVLQVMNHVQAKDRVNDELAEEAEEADEAEKQATKQ